MPLPQRTREMLREYWKTHRNPVWLFPSEGKDHIDLSKATEPMHKSSVQDAFHCPQCGGELLFVRRLSPEPTAALTI